MKRRIYYIFVLLSLMANVSCSLLDRDPESSWGSGNYFESESQLKALLNGAYNRVQSALGTNFLHYGDGRSDIYALNNLTSVGTENILMNRLNYDMSLASWRTLYSVIQHANLIIKNLPEMQAKGKVTPATAKSVLGQAHCLRAFAYFWIVRLWGDAPLITEPFDNVKAFNYKRSPEVEVRKLIHQDLATAKANLPSSSKDKIYFTSAAATAIDAQLYAWEHNWAQVIVQTQTILNSTDDKPFNSSTYKLAKLYDPTVDRSLSTFMTEELPKLEYVKMFNSGGSVESIFEISYLLGDMQNNDGLSGQLFGSYPAYKPSESYVAEFGAEDWRADAIFEGTTNRLRKFFIGYTQSQSARNIVLLRLAEIGLLKAEALINLSDTESDPEIIKANTINAMKLVNAVRVRAGGPAMEIAEDEYLTMTQDALKNCVLFERKLEVGTEGYRYFDLIRTGKVLEVMEPINGQNDIRSTLWPVLQSEIRDSKGLIEQNSYYK